MMTEQDLINFEEDIAAVYATGVIKGPVHLRNGYEKVLLKVAKNFGPNDIFFSTWASHQHALAAGIPAEKIKNQILEGRSITLCFPEHNFYTSAIVGGIAPIAVGAAMSVQRKNEDRHVWCFLGDMAYFTGIAQESIRYAHNHKLPLTFVVEDNGKSVCTPTSEAWQDDCSTDIAMSSQRQNIITYQYETKYPHSGVGFFIHF